MSRCTKILAENYLDTDIVSNAFASSEQAAFPSLNLYNAQRRSKVWRSNGYWLIVSGDNTIVFEETVATPLTATVAAGEYTSTASFLAAVKAALEAVGASTYTVVQDTATLKIKITSDGTGGGGILNLLWTHVNSADMAGILGYDTSADDTGALTYLADILRINTNEWLKWDFGISTNPKAFVGIGPRNSPIKLTPGSTLTLQGNITDTWTTPIYEQVITYGDDVFSLLSDTGLHTTGLRYWRFQIDDQSNPLGYVELGSLYLGDIYTTTRGAVEFPFSSGLVDRSNTVYSEGGQTFSDIKQKSQEFSLEWNALTYQELEQFTEIFERFGTSVPFFVSMDADGVFSSRGNYYLRFVKFTEAPQFDLTNPNYFSMTWNLMEQL